MSLINDALKRTRDANAPANAVPPAVTTVPPRRALDQPPANRTASIIVSIVVALVVLVGGAVMVWLFGQSWTKSRLDIYPATKIPPPDDPHTFPGNPPAVVAPTVTTVPPPVAVVETPPPPVPLPATPTPTPPPPPRARPTLVLQGVGIQGKYRDAMINGVTVKVGEEIEGAKVIDIQMGWVLVQFDGQEYKVYR